MCDKAIKSQPRIGVGVIVNHEGKTLLGKRRGEHGNGSWACSGGHLEYGESIEECAIRELAEETGLKAISVHKGPWISCLIEEKHYVTFFVIVDKFEGTPKLIEKDRCEGWEWFGWEQLPSPLFPTVKMAIEKEGKEALQTPHRSMTTLLEKLFIFFQEREWEQYHSPKNLVMNLATEVGELIEPFRWITEEASYHLDEKTQTEVGKEIADVFITLTYLANKLGIDPVSVSHEKLREISIKYPLEQCRGKALKYTAYDKI